VVSARNYPLERQQSPFVAKEAGTIVTVRHSNVPDGDLGYENGGWQQSYFTPMQAYFAAH